MLRYTSCLAASLPARNLRVTSTPTSVAPESGLGSKIGLDATDKWPPETNREWGRQIRMTDEVIEKVNAMWPELGLPGSGKPIWK